MLKLPATRDTYAFYIFSKQPRKNRGCPRTKQKRERERERGGVNAMAFSPCKCVFLFSSMFLPMMTTLWMVTGFFGFSMILCFCSCLAIGFSSSVELFLDKGCCIWFRICFFFLMGPMEVSHVTVLGRFLSWINSQTSTLWSSSPTPIFFFHSRISFHDWILMNPCHDYHGKGTLT
jgi:hypothetical protein